ncbi:Fc.00g079470.m01.CDS01 [Cosmosporella sp. VM-42]
MPANTSDIPVPSIEADSQSETSSQLPTPGSSLNRIRAPSVSVTPPPSSSSTQPSRRNSRNSNGGVNGSSSNQSRSQSIGITSGLQNIRLSSPNGVSNLSDLAEAVDNVARGSDSRSVSLEPGEQRDSPGFDTPRQRRRSRRSSSRLDRSPHDVSTEVLPEDAFHSSAFQQALRDAKQLMSDMESVLGSSALHNNPGSTIRRLLNEAGELAGFQLPSTRTVGFVGDSGVGKSSLLNSLLDMRGLARTSNSGEACTCVVTEYHYHNRESLNIEVNLFSMDELREQLTGMLQSYRHFHLHRSEMEDVERRDFEAKANLARDTFRAMFRGQLDDEVFLVSQTEDDALETLTRWAAASRPSGISTSHSGLSPDACSTALMQLSSEPPQRDRPATWPFIRVIKVFLNAHILSKGLVLVDLPGTLLMTTEEMCETNLGLPGLRDLNSARRIITERYLLECNEIFAICNIGRAVTDEGVHHVLELARRARLSNVGIVCTRSDDIQAEEAIRDWRGNMAATIKRHMDALVTDDRDQHDIQEELDDYGTDEDLLEDEREVQRDLFRRMENVRSRRRTHNLDLQTYLVRTRNTFVTRELRAKYNQRAADNEIKIFCVSNKFYWDHREEPRNISRPFLDLSGIIELRKHCVSIVANTQRRIATRYMKDEIPAFLAQVDLWVQSGARTASEERREAICRTLDKIERRLRREINSNTGAINRIARYLKDDFTNHIYGRRRISRWSRSAREAGSEWSGWHHSSYAAFCRNFGDYCTPVAGEHNWNEEAISEMAEDLEDPWQELCSSLQQRQVDLTNFAETVTNNAIERLEADLDNDFDTTAPLVQVLVTRQGLFLDALEQAYDKLETDLDDARRKGIINSKLADEDLFKTLMRTVRDRFRAHSHSIQERAQTAATAYLDIVEGAFDLVRNENVARESEQDPEFRNRVDDLTRAGMERMQRIQVAVNA